MPYGQFQFVRSSNIATSTALPLALASLLAATVSGCMLEDDNRLAEQQFAVNTILGTSGDDMLTGSDSQIDNIWGYAGADVLDGKAQNDRLVPGADGAVDQVYGGPGNDTVSYEDATGSVTVNLQTGVAPDGDQLFSIENIIGSPYDDILTGDDNGNIIDVRDGSDTVDGGAGVDRIAFSSLTKPVVVVMEDGNALSACGDRGIALTEYGTAAETTVFDNIESAYGSPGHDTIRGTAGIDVIYGADGDDRIYSGDGDDEIIPGIGDDTVILANGAALIKVVPASGSDRVYEFTADDRLDVRNFGTDFASLNIQYGVSDAVLTLDATTMVTFKDIGFTLTSANFLF